MIDAHIHLENGSYTEKWLNEFISTAQKRGIDEIHVLEHTHRFFEFMPLYQQVREVSKEQQVYFDKKHLLPLSAYTNFIREMRKKTFPIKVQFGLEVCYFPQHEAFIKEMLDQFDYDFVVGSVHFIDNMAYDLHGISEPLLWDRYDVNWIWKRYFDLSEQLIKSDLFDGMAHPDTIKLFHRLPSFDTKPYWHRLSELLNEHAMYTENNVGCYYRYNHEDMGLNADVLAIFKEHQVRLLCASDSHGPANVGIHLQEIAPLTLG